MASSKEVNIFDRNNETRKRMLMKRLYGTSIRPNGTSYLDYIKEVYGTEDYSISFINNLLVGIKPESAIRQNKVGTIDYPRVLDAMNGNITTNPNYSEYSKIIDIATLFNVSNDFNQMIDIMKDSDTKLGVISNQMYSSLLYYSAKVNSARGRRDPKSGFSYITPSLYEYYGNNLLNVGRLGEEFYIDKNTGRIRNTNEDLEVGILYPEDVVTAGEINETADYGQGQYLLNQLKFQRQGIAIERGITYYTFTQNNPNTAHGIGYVGTISSDSITLPNGPTITQNLSWSNDLSKYRGSIYIYDEGDEAGDKNKPVEIIDEQQALLNQYHSFNSDTSGRRIGNGNLLSKTNKMFNEHRIGTMVARFYGRGEGIEPSYDNAYNSVYGNSHGRNLLKLGANKIGFNYDDGYGYNNPYCRTWTYHYQYDRYSRAIRPFIREREGENPKPYTIKEVQNTLKQFRVQETKDGLTNGGEYLDKYTVLGDNGFVKIGPYEKGDEQVDIKNYMLSIENLAWKKYPLDIEEGRLGPNGGRIMWFPPYDLQFNESVNVEWNSNTFIGRGEKVYTYSNTDRTANLSFVVLVDHPSIIDTDAYRSFEGYDGSDAVSDTLRYFAGCETFMELENNKSDEEDGDKNPKQTVLDEPIPTISGDKVIQFAIFFPNNYSGNKTQPSSSNDRTNNKIAYENASNRNGGTDDDWIQYLLYGKDCNGAFSKPDDYGEGYTGIGYEMSGTGISTTGSTDIIKACSKKADMDFSPCSKALKDPEKFFHYRVDFDLRQNMLKTGTDSSYIDSASFKFNSSLESINTNTDGNFKCNCSFAEFVLGIYQGTPVAENENGWYQKVKSHINTTFENEESRIKSQKRIDDISNLFSTSHINKIKTTGCATQQDKGNSSGLALRRSKTACISLRNIFNDLYNTTNNSNHILQQPITTDFKNISIWQRSEDKNPGQTINSAVAKYQRSVKVEIHFGQSKKSVDGADVEENPAANRETSQTPTETSNTNTTVKKTNGYEYEYFKKLAVTDPVLFRSIKDRYKNFDPAFHSMSPEGFNARLNFLQQCTRQGHTLSASEVNNSSSVAPTAGNLAFGMMPVCVLRIGDFINSRIIIQSLNIDYSRDGMQWDLNPEGVGVQPMFARVNMSIVLIGGSALNMPVNRLQNAQTFDYYANTGVYDSRADRVSMKDGDVNYDYLYIPSKKVKNEQTAPTENGVTNQEN